MKKHTTTYDIDLDHIDLQSIRSQPIQDGTAMKPLWSGPQNQDRYRFEVETQENMEYDYSTVSCQICNIKVPTKYIKEHKNSDKHQICKKIADTALDRIQSNILKDKQSTVIEPVAGYFCEPCSTIVTSKHHETSEIHKSSIHHDKLLEDLIMIYSNRDNINNIKFKYLTNINSKDIKNDAETTVQTDCKNKCLDRSIDMKSSTVCESDLEIVDEIKHLTDCDYKDIKINNVTEHPTDCKKKDLGNNIQTECSTDCQYIEHVEEITYTTDYDDCKNKDLGNNMEIKCSKVCQSEDLEIEEEITCPTDLDNNIEMKCLTVCQSEDLEIVEEITYPSDCNNKYIENNDDIKHPTDLDNNIDIKCPIVCQVENLENVDQITYPTDCNNEDKENNDDIKHPTDLGNNIEIKYPAVCQSEDLESVKEITYPTEDIENNDGIKYPTDLDNNIEMKCPTVCQSEDLEIEKGITSPTDYENNYIYNYDDIKHPTDLDNNIKMQCPTVCQSEDLKRVDEIRRLTDNDYKDIKINSVTQHPTNYKEKDLDHPLECTTDSKIENINHNKEIKYPTDCKNENFNEVKKESKSDIEVQNKKDMNKKQDIESVATDQIIYKHTTIITDLKSIENYFKIIMEIFSHTSLIYFYINKAFVGINIGDIKLKVHVDSFLGINSETNMCMLCSIKFTDRDQHIYTIKHMKKVMAPINDQSCIRKVNETSFYCVICARVIVSKKVNEYTDKIENLEQKVTAHIKSKEHKTNFTKALLNDASQKMQVDDSTRTSKTFFDEHICNVCGLFVSNTVAKDRNTGSIHNSKYKEYFCYNCQMIMPLRSQIKHIEEDISENTSKNPKIRYNSVLQPKHTIKTYCGACDLYIDTYYLDSHTTSELHEERLAGNASLNKLAQTKAKLEDKAVTTNGSGRNIMSKANEVLEDLLWAQMEVSKNPKEVICKVCNVVVAKALKNVQDHIKGKTHQENFKILILSCNMKDNGLDQICARIEVNAKLKHVECKICNISIPNIPKDIEAHVIGFIHQNNISLLSNNIKEYKPHVEAQVMSSQISRYTKPVNVPVKTAHHKAVSTSKARAIPIENLIKTNGKNRVKILRPLNIEKGNRPVNVQADDTTQLNINNIENIIFKPTWQMKGTTNVTGINPPKNSITNNTILRPPNFKEDINPINVQAGTTYVTEINQPKNNNVSINPILHPLNFKEDFNPINVQASTSKVKNNNSGEVASQSTLQVQRTKITAINPPKNNKTLGDRILRPVNFKDIRPTNEQAGTTQGNGLNSENIASKRQTTANVGRGINLSKKSKKTVNKMRRLLKITADLKQYHCIVCKIEIALSTDDVNEHLLGTEHENNYRRFLSSNKIEPVRDGKLYCKLCNFEFKDQRALIHIERIIHQTNIKPFIS